jgi:hypothetical protein
MCRDTAWRTHSAGSSKKFGTKTKTRREYRRGRFRKQIVRDRSYDPSHDSAANEYTNAANERTSQ